MLRCSVLPESCLLTNSTSTDTVSWFLTKANALLKIIKVTHWIRLTSLLINLHLCHPGTWTPKFHVKRTLGQNGYKCNTLKSCCTDRWSQACLRKRTRELQSPEFPGAPVSPISPHNSCKHNELNEVMETQVLLPYIGKKIFPNTTTFFFATSFLNNSQNL